MDLQFVDIGGSGILSYSQTAVAQKFYAKRAVSVLDKCSPPRFKCVRLTLLCSIKLQCFWWQNLLRILLTIETFLSLSSAEEIDAEIAMLMFGASPSFEEPG